MMIEGVVGRIAMVVGLMRSGNTETSTMLCIEG